MIHSFSSLLIGQILLIIPLMATINISQEWMSPELRTVLGPALWIAAIVAFVAEFLVSQKTEKHVAEHYPHLRILPFWKKWGDKELSRDATLRSYNRQMFFLTLITWILAVAAVELTGFHFMFL